MTKRPIEFLQEDFPKLFNHGVKVLEARAAAGDEQAQRVLADVTGVTGAVRIELDDASPIVLSAAAGTLTAGDSPEAGVPLKVAAQVPEDAVQLLLGEALSTGALEDEEVAVGAAQTASKRFEEALAGRPMTLTATVKGVPGLGDVELRVAFNVPEVPPSPGFTTEVEFADLEATRRGELTVQELFLGGKLKMEGDYSMALQISMQLLTNPL
ncbi:MAG: SCP2 sterol-binding domain-containing protein [Myxococcota bacterium]